MKIRTDQSTQSHPCGTSGIAPANSASRAGAMPEASGIGDRGRLAENMKTFTIAIRLLGICVALWFLYTAVTMWVSIYSQVLAADEVRPIQDHSKTLLIDFFVTKPLPFVCFAILLLLPYGRLNRIVVIGLSCALLCLGFYSWREIFGIFFFSSRLVLEVIPLPVIAYTTAFLLFLLAFVSTIILNKQNSRTDRCT